MVCVMYAMWCLLSDVGTARCYVCVMWNVLYEDWAVCLDGHSTAEVYALKNILKSIMGGLKSAGVEVICGAGN